MAVFKEVMMKLSFDCGSRPINLVGVLLLCGLTAVGCSKKEESTEKSEKTKVEVVTTAPVVQCDDQMALTQLTHSIQSSLGSQTQNLFNNYADSNGETLSLTDVKDSVGSVLVDIANPKVIQEANSKGMLTCSASLSLTLPNQDVTRADRVYKRVEDRSLDDLLRSEGIVLNNNMLVSDNFNYIVGMQGGQAVARLVGQPSILLAAADVIAKSQYQSVIDARTSAPNTIKVRPAPTLPAEPKQRSAPRVRPEPEQKQKAPVRQSQPAEKPAESSDKAKSSKPSTVQKDSQAVTAKPVEKDKPLTAAKDDNIDMVIVEEEGTY
ncbi:hypothetical protein [Psychrobacter sp.]|uniref:hypothetical protein n=1 Tax=Psychrobacter sp. TaxID=56811 RepID=UPI0025EA698B|nr:hypothetical protein [Psychrobacter sp.]